jgi:hypothetical protein
MIKPDQSDWANQCPMAKFAINLTVSSTMEFAPFELNYGWMPTMITELSETQYKGIKQFTKKALWNLSAAHNAIIMHRMAQIEQANKLRQLEPTIKVGDLMYLSTRDLNLPKGRAKKLQPHYIGPYAVSESWPDKLTSFDDQNQPSKLVTLCTYP